jgi:hypothetical protein
MERTLQPNTQTLDPNRARRALGAMFFFAFGGAWLGYYAFQVTGMQPVILASIALISLILIFSAYRRYKQHKPALLAEGSSPQQKKADRVFNIVNAAQWVAIFIVANVLVNLSLSHWVIPAIIFIVGMHFLPLARVFANPPHYVTGAALIVLSVAYPLLAPSGPVSPVGCLGAGLILWASALWAVVANNSFKADGSAAA